MPRVTINKEKYMEADAVAFIEGKTRGTRQTDRDMAALLGLSPPAYCQRKKNGKMNFSYLELVKMIKQLKFSDEEIVKLMRGAL
jgi:hypothetical protein